MVTKAFESMRSLVDELQAFELVQGVYGFTAAMGYMTVLQCHTKNLLTLDAIRTRMPRFVSAMETMGKVDRIEEWISKFSDTCIPAPLIQGDNPHDITFMSVMRPEELDGIFGVVGPWLLTRWPEDVIENPLDWDLTMQITNDLSPSIISPVMPRIRKSVYGHHPDMAAILNEDYIAKAFAELIAISVVSSRLQNAYLAEPKPNALPGTNPADIGNAAADGRNLRGQGDAGASIQ